MRQVSKLLMTIILLAGCAGIAQAEMSNEERAIKMRKGAYSVLSWYFGSMMRMAKGAEPFDQARFAHDAEALAFLSKLPKDAFIPGSDKGDTKARPEIWSQATAFRQAGEKLEAEARKLSDMAARADQQALGDQLKQVQKSCKSCHEDFKQRSN